jgi:hypothetical protein
VIDCGNASSRSVNGKMRGLSGRCRLFNRGFLDVRRSAYLGKEAAQSASGGCEHDVGRFDGNIGANGQTDLGLGQGRPVG